MCYLAIDLGSIAPCGRWFWVPSFASLHLGDFALKDFMSSHIEEWEILDLLTGLVNKSMAIAARLPPLVEGLGAVNG